MARFVGRRKLYSNAEIARIPCARCGAPSYHQWSICANGNRWATLCKPCDVALNAMALRFFRIPNRKALLARYRKRGS